MLRKEAAANSVRVASVPPATTASASPYWIMRTARPMPWAPLAHADPTWKDWPRRPCFMVIAAAAAFGMYWGTPSGETCRAPRSRITSSWVSIVPCPPIPVAITQPTR